MKAKKLKGSRRSTASAMHHAHSKISSSNRMAATEVAGGEGKKMALIKLVPHSRLYLTVNCLLPCLSLLLLQSQLSLAQIIPSPFGTSNHHQLPHLTSSPFLYYMTKNGLQLPVSSPAVSSFSSPSAFFSPSSPLHFSSPSSSLNSFGVGGLPQLHSDFADFSSFFPGGGSSSIDRSIRGDNLKVESVNSMSFLPPLQSVRKPPHTNRQSPLLRRPLPTSPARPAQQQPQIKLKSPPSAGLNFPHPKPKLQLNLKNNQIKPKSPVVSAAAATPTLSKLPSQTPFKPIFGARLTATAAASNSKESPKNSPKSSPPASPVYIKPKSQVKPSHHQLPPPPPRSASPFVHTAPIGPRTKPTTSTSTTTTTTSTTTIKPTLLNQSTTPVDDEFDVDYIDNADERLKGVTHLNLTNEDLWQAESQAMATVLKGHEVKNMQAEGKSAKAKSINETRLLASASEQQPTALPTRELGLDLNNFQSKDVDFSTIFSSYKSPELKFDPFKVFDTESTTGSSSSGEGRSPGKPNLFSNDPTIEYVTTDRKLSDRLIVGGDGGPQQQQETDQPVFVPLEENNFSRLNNNNNFNSNNGVRNNNNNHNNFDDEINTKPLNTFQWSSHSSALTTDKPLTITTTTNSNSAQSLFESSFENLPPSTFSSSSSSLFDSGNGNSGQLSPVTSFTQNLNSNPFPAIEEQVQVVSLAGAQRQVPTVGTITSTLSSSAERLNNNGGNGNRPFSTTTSSSVPSLLSSFIAGDNSVAKNAASGNLATYDLKKAFDNLRSVRKDYAEPVKNAADDGNQAIGATGGLGGGGSIPNYQFNNLAPSVANSNFQAGEGHSQAKSPTSTAFFNDVKLSDDFYVSRPIPDRYLNKLNGGGGGESVASGGYTSGGSQGVLSSSVGGFSSSYSGNAGGGGGHSGVQSGSGFSGVAGGYSHNSGNHFYSSLSADSAADKWKGIDGFQSERLPPNTGYRTSKGPHVASPPAQLTSIVGQTANNGRPITRLIPQASVEEVPLPSPGEYNVPEIIHNGDHIVRVEKVPLKNLHDAYYNPAIPEDSTPDLARIPGSVSSVSNGIKQTKASRLKKANGKHRKSSSSKGGKSGRKKSAKSSSRKNSRKAAASSRRKSSKQTKTEDETSIESPVIDDVQDEVNKAAGGVANGLLPGSIASTFNNARGQAGSGVNGVVNTASGLLPTGGFPTGGVPSLLPGSGSLLPTGGGLPSIPGGVPSSIPGLPGTGGLIPSNIPGTSSVTDALDGAKKAVAGAVATTTPASTEDDVEDDDDEETSTPDKEEDDEGEKEGTTSTTTTTEKPDTDEEDEDTETTSEKPSSTDDEDSSSEDSSDTETTTESSDSSGEDSSSDDDDSSSSSTTEAPPTTTTTTTAKPNFPYPPFPYPPPFPPFFYPPPPGYPGMKGGMPYLPPPPGYPPLPPPYPGMKMPYPPPPPPGYPPLPPPYPGMKMPYPPLPPPYPGMKMPYPPPSPPYPPSSKPYSGNDNNYRPPAYPPPPPPSYSGPAKPVSYTYTNSQPPYQPQQQQPPNYPPPPAYPPPYRKPYKDDGYGDKGNPPVEEQLEVNMPDIVKHISLGSPKPKYPPKEYNNYQNPQKPQYYQGKPMSYYQYNYRRNDQPSGGYTATPPPPQMYTSSEAPQYPQNSGYQKQEYPQEEKQYPQGNYGGGYKEKENIANINADIFLGDMMGQGQEPYPQPNYGGGGQAPAPQYPVNVYPEEVYPQSYEGGGGGHQSPSGYADKKPANGGGYFSKLKESMKRILPRLRPHSGDAYPPQLDEHYRAANGSASQEVTPWSLGEAEVDTRPPPMMYRCEDNRVGKCVIPANWAQQLAEISQQQQTYPGNPEGSLSLGSGVLPQSYPLASSSFSSLASAAVVKPPVGVMSFSSSSAVAGQS